MRSRLASTRTSRDTSSGCRAASTTATEPPKKDAKEGDKKDKDKEAEDPAKKRAEEIVSEASQSVDQIITAKEKEILAV